MNMDCILLLTAVKCGGQRDWLTKAHGSWDTCQVMITITLLLPMTSAGHFIGTSCKSQHPSYRFILKEDMLVTGA